MKGFVLGVVASAIAFVILVQVLPDNLLGFAGDTTQLAVLALAIGLVNAIVKPVVRLLSFPINLVTLGLAGLVINAVLVLAIAYVANTVLGFGLTVGGFPGGSIGSDTVVGAFAVSILLGILTAIVGLFVKD